MNSDKGNEQAKPQPNQASRGENWVIVQFILLAAIVLIPTQLFGLPTFTDTWMGTARILGIFFIVLGLAVVLLASLTLGTNLTAFPKPRDDGTLIQTGIYSLVRHPIYFGLLLASLGWSLLRGSLPSLLLTIALGIFFDQKSRREERWLMTKFSEYASYRQGVHKLIPWLY